MNRIILVRIFFRSSYCNFHNMTEQSVYKGVSKWQIIHMEKDLNKLILIAMTKSTNYYIVILYYISL